MPATITRGADVISPDLILGYETSTESGNVEHRLIGGGMNISLVDDDLRTGDLHMFFASEADAWAAHALHKVAGVWTVVESDVPGVSMLYVRKGRMALTLDPETALRWTLTVGYREVLA